ncbi:hypothetical protein [Sphingomonas pruni]|uniref:hypothetical protein n=1 Tax=Sphingomonas pruni TaxID=40683 RepID=UPI00082C1438|nr:hypothetical protein [Sphingomonas pruni]
MDWKHIENTNTVARQLRAMTLRSDEVAAGHKRAAFLFGPPGVGKSMTVREALMHFKLRGHDPVECHPANYQELLLAFAEADGVRPVVLEEADVVWRSERMMNILKIATDKDRVLSQRVYQGVNIAAPIFLTTNIDLSNLADASSAFKKHGPALFRRVSPRGVQASTEELWEYSIVVALHYGLLDHAETEIWGVMRKQPRPLETRARALKWFSEQRENLLSVSPGTLKEVALAFDYADPDHQQLELDALLVPVAQRSRLVRDGFDWSAEIVRTSAKLRSAA